MDSTGDSFIMDEIMYSMIQLYKNNESFKKAIDLGYSPNIQSFLFLATNKPEYTIEEILSISSKRKATIEEDKIYGVIGLCQELKIEIK